LVGKDYFDTTGIPILQGRGFRADDENEDAAAIIVSQELVRKYWQGENPLGKHVEISNGGTLPPRIMPGSTDYRSAVSKNGPHTFEVVGVAGDVANNLLMNKKRPAIYFPFHPSDFATPSLQGMTLMVRTTPGTNGLEVVQREFLALDVNVRPFNARSMNDQITDFMSPLRSAAWTYGLIGIFGLVLASVGLAGMTAYSVVQRTHEIGIRVALGARKADVLRLLMKEGTLLITAGTAIGFACAWAGSRMLSAMNSAVGQVTATSASDPIVLFGSPILLASLALFACYLPARRSMQINPVETLRQD
jgi:putative ABC transport system permease protein